MRPCNGLNIVITCSRTCQAQGDGPLWNKPEIDSLHHTGVAVWDSKRQSPGIESLLPYSFIPHPSTKAVVRNIHTFLSAGGGLCHVGPIPGSLAGVCHLLKGQIQRAVPTPPYPASAGPPWKGEALCPFNYVLGQNYRHEITSPTKACDISEKSLFLFRNYACCLMFWSQTGLHTNPNFMIC